MWTLPNGHPSIKASESEEPTPIETPTPEVVRVNAVDEVIEAVDEPEPKTETKSETKSKTKAKTSSDTKE